MRPTPVRWLDEHDAPAAERALLEAARSHAPVDYDVEAGAARFRVAIAALAAGGAATATHATAAGSGAGGKTLFSKLVAKVLLSVAVGTTFVGVGMVAGVMMARRSAPGQAAALDAPLPTRTETRVAAPSEPPAPAAPSAAPVPGPANAGPSFALLPRAATVKPRVRPSLRASPAGARQESAAIPDNAPAAAPEATANPPPAEPTATAKTTPEPTRADSPSKPPPSDGTRPLGELQGIAIARDLVARDPSASLAVLDRLRREHPNGYFVEEREALTVLALAGDGQQAAARQRASAFLHVFPNGPFSEQVREILTRR